MAAAHDEGPGAGAARGEVRVSVLLLAAFATTQPVTMNVFVPSLASVAADLHASQATVQLTLSLYLIAFAFAQLVYGPLSDRFGRKPMLLGAFALLVLGSALCAGSQSIAALVAGRVVQAVGACGGMVLTRAILRDVHGRAGTARGLGLMTALTAGSAAFAPAVGGLLDVRYGWRAGFVLVAVLAVALALAAWRRLAETNPAGAGMRLGALSGAALRLLRSPLFVACLVNSGLTMAAWMGVVAGFPHVMSNLLGFPPTEYGRWFPILTAGYVCGNLLTARLAGRIRVERLIVLGSTISLLAAVALPGLVAYFGLRPAVLFGPVAIMVLGHGISQQNAIAAAVSVVPAVAGSASGILGFAHMLAAAVSAQLAASLVGTTVFPLLALIVGLTFASVVAGWMVGRADPG